MQTCRGYRCGSRCPELQRCSVGAGSGVQVSSAGPDTGRWTDVCVSPHPAYWTLELSGKLRGFSQCAEKAPTRIGPSPCWKLNVHTSHSTIKNLDLPKIRAFSRHCETSQRLVDRSTEYCGPELTPSRQHCRHSPRGRKHSHSAAGHTPHCTVGMRPGDTSVEECMHICHCQFFRRYNWVSWYEAAFCDTRQEKACVFIYRKIHLHRLHFLKWKEE